MLAVGSVLWLTSWSLAQHCTLTARKPTFSDILRFFHTSSLLGNSPFQLQFERCCMFPTEQRAQHLNCSLLSYRCALLFLSNYSRTTVAMSQRQPQKSLVFLPDELRCASFLLKKQEGRVTVLLDTHVIFVVFGICLLAWFWGQVFQHQMDL